MKSVIFLGYSVCNIFNENIRKITVFNSNPLIYVQQKVIP